MMILMALGTAAFITTITAFVASVLVADLIREKSYAPATAFTLFGLANLATATLTALAFGSLQ